MLSNPHSARPKGTAFTYQGRLSDGGSLANGNYDLRFAVYDAASDGSVIGGPLTNSASISNGLFTAALDFGDGVFTGPPRWLQITVNSNSAPPGVSLSPREQITPSPYAIFAAMSATVTNGAITSAQLANNSVGTAQIQANAINSGQIATGQVVKNVNGLTDAVTLSAGANVTIATNGNALQFSAPNTGGWGLNGNSGTTPGLNFVGTRDNQAFEAHVNGVRAMRLEPTSNNSANTNLVNVIGGSPANFVTPGMRGATIGGGGAVYYFGQLCTNSVTGDFGTVSGGQANVAAGESFVGGGQQNTASGVYATIGGGSGNIAAGSDSFIGGGVDNFTKLSYSFVGGGGFNSCSNNFGVIGGGYNNSVAQDSEGGATLGGEFNFVGQRYNIFGITYTNATYGAIGGGFSNNVFGTCGTVAGGYGNIAGPYSFAAGWGAKAFGTGTFVWSDPGIKGIYNALGDNTFNVYCSDQLNMQGGTSQFGMSSSLGIRLDTPTGGIDVLADGSVYVTTQKSPTVTGVYIAAGGSGWNSASDRNVKENFTDIDSRDVLEKVAQMPISMWNYKTQKKEIRHIGPMAQDFHAAFAVGEDNKHINNLDEEGVALAAIQGLNEKLEAENAELNRKNQLLEKRLDALEKMILNQKSN